MAETARGSAAAANPGGGGSDGGGSGGGGSVGSGSGNRPTPSASPVASPTKSGKEGAEDEGSEPMEAPAAAAAAEGRSLGPSEVNVAGKPLLQKARRPLARMLSQHRESPHVTLSDNEISIGSDGSCHIYLNDQTVSRNLCMLRHLEQRGPCELEVTDQYGRVVVNGRDILRDAKVPLRGGDEVIFGQSGKHAYIFQHPMRDAKVTKAVLISAHTGPTILASGPINPEGSLVIPTAYGENNQRVAESALKTQSDFRCPNPPVTLPLSKWQAFKDGLRQGIRNPKDIDVTLDKFPYYLSENTRDILLSSAFVHMDKFSKSFPKISSLNQRILLSGPSGSEIYQETLIMALAKEFEARLLILDFLTLCSCKESIKDARWEAAPSISGPGVVGASDRSIFREGDRVKYIGNGWLNQSLRGPAYGCQGKVLAFENNSSSKVGVRFNNPITGGNNLGGLCENNHGLFCHAAELRPDSSGGEEVGVALGNLIEVISEESKSSNLVVLLKDVEKSCTECCESHASLRNELPPGALIIGSHTQAENPKDKPHPEGFNFLRPPSKNLMVLNIVQETLGWGLHKINRCATMSMEYVNNLFPNNICIQLPQNEAQLSNLKKQLDCDTETLKAKANVLNIQKFLTSREFECNDLQELSIKDESLTNENLDKIVGFAIIHHLQHNKPPNDGKMVLPIESLKHGFNMLQNTQ